MKYLFLRFTHADPTIIKAHTKYLRTHVLKLVLIINLSLFFFKKGTFFFSNLILRFRIRLVRARMAMEEGGDGFTKRGRVEVATMEDD